MKCKEVDQQGALIIYFSLHFRNFVSNCLSNPVSKDWATKNCRFWHAPIWPKYLSESPFRLSSNTSRSSAWARESSFAMLSPWLLIICRNSMIESLNILKDESYLFHLHWSKLGLTNSRKIFLFELKHNHAYSAIRNRDKWRSGIFHVQMKHYSFFP